MSKDTKMILIVIAIVIAILLIPDGQYEAGTDSGLIHVSMNADSGNGASE